MTIIAQSKMVVNYDHVVTIQYNFTDIICQMNNGNIKILGSYDTEQRAAEVYKEMLATAFPPDILHVSTDRLDVEDLTAFRKGFRTLVQTEDHEAQITRYNPSTY